MERRGGGEEIRPCRRRGGQHIYYQVHTSVNTMLQRKGHQRWLPFSFLLSFSFCLFTQQVRISSLNSPPLALPFQGRDFRLQKKKEEEGVI